MLRSRPISTLLTLNRHSRGEVISRAKPALPDGVIVALESEAAVAPPAHLLLCKSPRNPADPCERTLEIVERGAGEAGSAQFDIANQ